LHPDILAGIASATHVQRRAVQAPNALNEAIAYGSAFSRGLRLEFGNTVVLLISGTASIDDEGRTVHVGDFRAQLLRTFANIQALLASEGATWKDIVRTTCYLRDIDRDYAAFNEERTRFYAQEGLHPYPASVGVQAILCRPDLLVEIEAVAVFLKPPGESCQSGAGFDEVADPLL
jgi:enamine deaminase RidA (YjgF/YER057c/UK114 family)